MAHDLVTVLTVVKARLNRLPTDTSLDMYLAKRIEAADEELMHIGINLKADSVEDMMLLSDYVAEGHSNRDKGGGMPEWLRLKRRERWLADRRRAP